MKQELLQLVRLQDLMRRAEADGQKIAAVPASVARLEKELLGAQEEVDRESARLEELQKDRRKLEGDLMAVETRIEKFQSQLQEVKTNKEYQAMLREIETCRSERARLDERILLEMEESDQHSAVFRQVEERLEAKRRDTEQGKRRLADEVERMKREKAELETERDQIASTIHASFLDPFMKVARQRKGVALVPVEEELCGGCHVRVMPTLIQQIRRATSLIACDSCRRFLYVPEPPAATAGTDAGPAAT